MSSDEHLHKALSELKKLRDAERSQLSQSQAVLAGLEKITAAGSPDQALNALLTSVRSSTDCDATLLLECSEGRCLSIASTDANLGDCRNVNADFISARAMLVDDMTALSAQADALSCKGLYQSMISAPFKVQTGETLVLVCLSKHQSTLTSQHQQIAERLMSLASHTLAAKRLADQNAMLAKVLDRSSASFSIADSGDPDCKLIYVNDAFEDLTGYTRAEALDQNCRFLSAEDPNSKVRKDIRKTIDARISGQFEVRNKRKNGDLFWNNLSIFPVDAGDKSYIVATQWDLTSRVQAEQERDLARRQLVSALASVKEGILLLDPSDRIVFANDRFRTFYSLGTDTLTVGEEFLAAWSNAEQMRGAPVTDAQEHAITMLRALKTPQVQRERTLDSGFQVLETNTLTSVGGTVSVLSDVTALKVVQRQLSERVAAIDSVQDGIAITDPAGRILYHNSSHMHMFGYDQPNALVGRKWSRLYEVAQLQYIEQVAIPAMARTGQWRGDLMGCRKDGTTIAQEVTLTQIAGSGLICITRDISERIQNEAERATLREQLHSAQRQEAIGQMAAGLAHDFNNCLSVISGSATLAFEASSEDERLRHIQRITSASGQAAELTGRLLRFGSRNSQRVTLDIKDPVLSALGLAKSSLKGNVALFSDLPDTPVMCDVDPTDVLQVVINLVINARDAISGNPGTIHVGLQERDGADLVGLGVLGEIDQDKSYAAISVKDNGSGIAASELGAVFDAYVTTKSDAGGTGLGLAIVRSLTKANGGVIDVTSEQGRGTEFTIYWPLSGSAQPDEDNHNSEMGSVDLRGSKVIVVDDDIAVAETIATLLEKAGGEVLVCDDPDDAVEVVMADPSYWNVVLTDYDMPQMTGAELAKRLRAIDPTLPLVLCTALPETLAGKRTGSRLFDARLSKPVDAKQLVSEIGRTMRP